MSNYKLLQIITIEEYVHDCTLMEKVSKRKIQWLSLIEINKLTCPCTKLKVSHVQFDYNPSSNTFHYNFYSKDGQMFTIDHIIPKSKGGSIMGIDNLQPMIDVYNFGKGSKLNYDYNNPTTKGQKINHIQYTILKLPKQICNWNELKEESKDYFKIEICKNFNNLDNKDLVRFQPFTKVSQKSINDIKDSCKKLRDNGFQHPMFTGIQNTNIMSCKTITKLIALEKKHNIKIKISNQLRKIIKEL